MLICGPGPGCNKELGHVNAMEMRILARQKRTYKSLEIWVRLEQTKIREEADLSVQGVRDGVVRKDAQDALICKRMDHQSSVKNELIP